LKYGVVLRELRIEEEGITTGSYRTISLQVFLQKDSYPQNGLKD
jgi:hypothetical protein